MTRHVEIAIVILVVMASLTLSGIARAGIARPGAPDNGSVSGDAVQAQAVETAQLLRRLLGREGKREKNESRRGDDSMITRTLLVGGLERVYHLYVPERVRGTSAPLVIAFHGGGGNALSFARRIGLQQMADRHGYIVAAPEGVGRGGRGGSWNAGSADPSGYAEEARVDDLGFVTALIADASSLAPVNPARVYAMGLSKGGMMAYHAACALPGRFAAIAAVASTMSTQYCTAPAGVSLLHIHGTADENVPWEGGRGAQTGGDTVWPGVERGIAIWTRANQCSAMPLPQPVTQDTTCQSTRCGTGETVEICRVQGGGHAWPGSDPSKRQQRTDTYVSPYFNATEYIANFFDRT